MKSKSRREEKNKISYKIRKYSGKITILFDNSKFIVLILNWGILHIIKLINRER